MKANELADAVYRIWLYARGVLETESPCIYQRSHSNVESTVCVGRYGLGEAEYVCEHTVCLHVVVIIDVRDNRLLVEWRERVVYFL